MRWKETAIHEDPGKQEKIPVAVQGQGVRENLE
jgi:hypothetical protein